MNSSPVVQQKVEIELTINEMIMAAMRGVLIHLRQLGKDNGRWNQDKAAKGWGDDIDGSLGEAVVGKWSNYFLGIEPGAHDVGPLQVRATPCMTGHLSLHHEDRDADAFVLVLTGCAPRFTLAGWIVGREGKKEEFWTTEIRGKPLRYPCFMVEQELLRPMGELHTLLISKFHRAC
jgi:hypothetical protein